MWFSYRWLEPNFVTQMCGERESNNECKCDVQCELWTEGNKRLDYAISLATVMSSIEGLPCVQHNNKNDLEASGSHSNVDSNKDENESSSNSNTKIENASILDTVRLLALLSLFLYLSLFLTTSTKLKSILI